MTDTRRHTGAPVIISEPKSTEELEAYFACRWKLLRAPWNQPRGSERDEFDATSHHLLARDGAGEIVAVGRIHLPRTGEAQIRYMATRPDFQRQGIGRSILRRLERYATDNGARIIVLNARINAVPFYERLGYIVQGQVPTLFGKIEHKAMSKAL